MKTLAAVIVLSLAACSSSSPAGAPKKAQIPAPAFEIRQLVGPAQLTYEEGSIEVKLALDIGNRADVPMTLQRLDIVTVNPEGGAYTLDVAHREYYFRKIIEPHKAMRVVFWAKATGYGRSSRDSEPVTVRGTLYFDTPGGHYNHVFVKEIGQYEGQND
jgi:hypothetical protein